MPKGRKGEELRNLFLRHRNFTLTFDLPISLVVIDTSVKQRIVMLRWGIVVVTTTTIPQGNITIICIIGPIWIIQHLANALALEDNWSHDLHDVAERRSTFLQFVKIVAQMRICELDRNVMLSS